MSERSRIGLLILIMTVIALVVGGISIALLYRAAFEEEKARLIETAQSQARLLEAIGRHEVRANQEGASERTLRQIRDAHERYAGFGKTGEFTLARREGDRMVFLLSHRHYDLDLPRPVPLRSELAEPMRRSLSGQSGTVVGLDYRGETVLAAYEPVAELDWGIVAKIDMAEIQAPFVRAGVIAAISATVIITLGALLFIRVTDPLLRRLEESEQRFRSTFEQAAVGITHVTLDGHFLLLNQRFCDIVGYTQDELLALTFQELTHPDDLDADLKNVRRVLAGEIQTFSMEKRYIHKGGSIVWVNLTVSLVREPSGDSTYLIGVIQDITERVQAEETLEKQRKELQLILDTVPATIWFKDKHNRILRINRAAAETMGMLVEDIEGKTAYELFPEEAEHYYQDDLEVMNSGQAKLGIVEQMQIPSGEKRWVQTDKAPYYDEQGKVAGIVAFVVDITERVRAEVALREYSERLEEMVKERTRELEDAQEQLVRREKLAVLGQLAGGVGHELRNPLGVISNAVYYLQMTLPDANETAKEYLSMISSEVHTATKIISDLLGFARTQPAGRENVVVSALIARALEKQSPHGKVRISAEIPPDLPVVFVDPQQIEMVLGNLVTNAYDAMPEGGTLIISAKVERNKIALSISDTGCGISPENRGKLFEPLFSRGGVVSETLLVSGSAQDGLHTLVVDDGHRASSTKGGISYGYEKHSRRG
jgi:PAS domain S-box-containing protein